MSISGFFSYPLYPGYFNTLATKEMIFPVINFPILDGYLPLSPSYGVYFSQLVRFSRIRNDVSDFSVRNLVITETLVQQ